MDAIIEKYRNVCEKYGHPVRVQTVNDDSTHSWLVDNVITINTAKVPERDLMLFLSYRVREFILPRLAYETERLRVRRYAETDKGAVISALSNNETTLMFGGWGLEELPQKAEGITESMKTTGGYVLERKDSGQVVGFFNIQDVNDRAVDAMSISYVIAREHQRQGYACEAISKMMDILVNELDLELLEAEVFTFNEPSLKLLDKLGFVREGIKHKALWHSLHGASDCMIFYIGKD